MIDEVVLHSVGNNPPQARLVYGQHALDSLAMLNDNSVHTICTSPPYWGLRDYGTASWKGGDPNCNHTTSKDPDNLKTHVERPNGGHRGGSNKFCVHCGAERVDLQIGLEDDLEDYLDSLVQVFDACRRVLRPDGTLWVNLGDTYSRGSRKTVGKQSGICASKNDSDKYEFFSPSANLGGHDTIKPKDLVGIPWRFALAMQKAGWYLRSDIIWAKGSCMPESVKDRPTKAHEYVFLFAHPDSQGRYYYDIEAIKEPSVTGERFHGGYDALMPGGLKGHSRNGRHENEDNTISMRNKRSVWHVNPKGYREAHFAVWPPALVEPMVLAGCPEKGTVLDPFSGSATTGMVALKNGRNYIGLDLNEDYYPMAHTRVQGIKPSVKKTIQPPEVNALDLFGAD